jgi:hypothetical protein
VAIWIVFFLPFGFQETPTKGLAAPMPPADHGRHLGIEHPLRPIAPEIGCFLLGFRHHGDRNAVPEQEERMVQLGLGRFILTPVAPEKSMMQSLDLYPRPRIAAGQTQFFQLCVNETGQGPTMSKGGGKGKRLARQAT